MRLSTLQEWVHEEHVCRPALGDIFAEAAIDEALKVGRPLLRQPRRLLVHYLKLDSHLMLLFNVGRVSHGELKREDAQGPDIDASIILVPSLDYFWRHPAERANLRFAALVLLGQHDSKPKVGDLDLTLF